MDLTFREIVGCPGAGQGKIEPLRPIGHGKPRGRVGNGEFEMEIETARAQKGSINLVQTVGDSQDGHALEILDAVHFGQKLGW